MYDSSNTQKCKMTLGLLDKSIDPCKKSGKTSCSQSLYYSHSS